MSQKQVGAHEAVRTWLSVNRLILSQRIIGLRFIHSSIGVVALSLIINKRSGEKDCRGARTSACSVETLLDASRLRGPASAGVPTRHARVRAPRLLADRKSTRLNSSHLGIS